VATAIGGNPEVVVEGQTGFLAPSEDPERLAARILDLLRDPELRRRMGENGRERVREHFTVEVMVRRMSVLYQELLASRPRGA
jgi:glycosyltransferase involved in cell wall biosynthesis